MERNLSKYQHRRNSNGYLAVSILFTVITIPMTIPYIAEPKNTAILATTAAIQGTTLLVNYLGLWFFENIVFLLILLSLSVSTFSVTFIVVITYRIVPLLIPVITSFIAMTLNFFAIKRAEPVDEEVKVNPVTNWCLLIATGLHVSCIPFPIILAVNSAPFRNFTNATNDEVVKRTSRYLVSNALKYKDNDKIYDQPELFIFRLAVSCAVAICLTLTQDLYGYWSDNTMFHVLTTMESFASFALSLTVTIISTLKIQTNDTSYHVPKWCIWIMIPITVLLFCAYLCNFILTRSAAVEELEPQSAHDQKFRNISAAERYTDAYIENV
ncbi:unnamed protein product [Ambrosiozyma monospora]|uniref:Unnamed protein product n=1 Tax=Ambrosiozyma monospora TaxID=43982 RepID=A0A9W6YR41_AMBMO|nr:unnamed protein product [Ambrosiozyma monospora]